MSKRKERPAELLLKLPWWVSAGIGLIAIVFLKGILPTVAAQNQVTLGFARLGDTLAPIAFLVFAALSVGSALFARKRRRLVDEQTSLESLRAVSWKDFEFLVAEAYRRRGFTADYGLGAGADGGVDIMLRKDGRTTLVQCKQWKSFKVGAPIVRELLGAMTANHANAGIVVTAGTFTRDAHEFASANNITLVDGPALLSLVREVQHADASAKVATNQTESSPVAPPICRACNVPMVRRTARRGANAGSDFWGCSNYPRCKETRPI